MRRRLLLFFLLIVFPCNILAFKKNDCDITLYSNLKKIASNVNVTYDYHLVDDNVMFELTLTNITEDIYFKISGSNYLYHFSDTDNGIISFDNFISGVHKISFYSNNSECLNKKLFDKIIDLPYYNKFYNYDICSYVPDYKLCQKWIKYDGDYESFRKEVVNYINSLNSNINEDENVNLNFFDRLINYFVKYYYLFLPLFIIIVFGIFYLVKYIKFRKNRFDI